MAEFRKGLDAGKSAKAQNHPFHQNSLASRANYTRLQARNDTTTPQRTQAIDKALLEKLPDRNFSLIRSTKLQQCKPVRLQDRL